MKKIRIYIIGIICSITFLTSCASSEFTASSRRMNSYNDNRFKNNARMPSLNDDKKKCSFFDILFGNDDNKSGN